jgi:hypothetical protein
VLKFEDALGRYRKRRLTGDEAGELLGSVGRHFRRLAERYDEDGREGLRDRRLGKVSPVHLAATQREQDFQFLFCSHRWASLSRCPIPTRSSL